MNSYTNDGSSPARLSIDTTQGKLVILFTILITIGILAGMTFSCINSCEKETAEPVQAVSGTSVSESDTVSFSDYAPVVSSSETVSEVTPSDAASSSDFVQPTT